MYLGFNEAVFILRISLWQVGLAVDDVQELRKQSERMRMKSMVGWIDGINISK